jgi:hypothetical protein
MRRPSQNRTPTPTETAPVDTIDAPPKWITKAEAAALVGVTTKTIERWAKDKRIKQASRPSQNNGPAVAVYWLPAVAKQAAARAVGPGGGLRVPLEPADGAGLPAVLGTNGHGLALGKGLDPIAFGVTLLAAFRQVSQTSETSETPPPAFVDVATFARLAGLSAADIHRAIAAGELPHRTTSRGGIRLWAEDVALLRPPRP